MSPGLALPSSPFPRLALPSATPFRYTYADAVPVLAAHRSAPRLTKWSRFSLSLSPYKRDETEGTGTGDGDGANGPEGSPWIAAGSNLGLGALQGRPWTNLERALGPGPMLTHVQTCARPVSRYSGCTPGHHSRCTLSMSSSTRRAMPDVEGPFAVEPSRWQAVQSPRPHLSGTFQAYKHKHLHLERQLCRLPGVRSPPGPATMPL
ncbi:hypothetical protein QBC39DRAFT_162913 [Podospora conica]|nr:hypothetical protein QBC39DRAFT_162913 [Schizothecium conicum]